MSGRISIRSDREPDFFRLLEKRGPHIVLVAAEDGAVVGSVSTARVQVRIDEEIETIHYLGDLKTHPDHRGKGLAVRLLRAMRERLRAEGADLVVSTAAQGNGDVLSFFGGRSGLPRALALGTFHIDQILPSARGGAHPVQASVDAPKTDELCRFYNDFYRDYQFGPLFSPEGLNGCFHWESRSDGVMEAALSLIDLGDAKQNVLIKLPLPLRTIVAAIQSVSSFIPTVELPRTGQAIRMLYIKAMACREGGEAALDRLLDAARRFAFERKVHFLAAGLHERDPLRRRLTRFPKFTFKSMGFVVGLRRGRDDLARLALRVPYEDYSLV